ncbi:hypothetical protein P9990_17610 [Prescottella equi]|uniref:hypothetical protein n=1 Tax=Rhodococcus hoagii TaxID=43767 RepID=UPI0025757E9C|nr:hypothetical protein [Prescottella equi]WJJ10389.1 hypothetical protein P9990_17610 [Prescottella equi]
MKSPDEVAAAWLALVRPHVSDSTVRGIESDMSVGESCAAIRTGIHAAVNHGIVVPRQLVQQARHWCIDKRGVHRRLIVPTAELLDRVRIAESSAA